jgi:hypothetical protein
MITLEAISENFTEAIYVYSVKRPGSVDFESASFPFPLNDVGIYTFAVTAAESSNPTVILATDTIEIEVRVLPEPITIKLYAASIPDEWRNTNGDVVSFYAWGEEGFGAGQFYTSILAGDWYVYTFTRRDFVNLLFVSGTEFTSPLSNHYQTVDILDITASTCFIIEGQQDSGADWMKWLVVVDAECEGDIPSNIEQSEHQQVLIFVDNGIIHAQFEGRAQVELFSITGQLLRSEIVENRFAHPTPRGIYLLRVNGQAHKVIVQ